MFQTNIIVLKEQINFLHIKNQDRLMLLGRTVCHLMDQLQPKTGNCLEIYFLFLSIVLILCLLNISNEYYRETGVYTLSEKHNIFVSE